MHLTINKEELLNGLLIAGHAIGSKASNPILLNFRLEVTNRGLEITGSDSDLTIHTLVPMMMADSEIIRDASSGATLVNARILTELVRKINSAEVTLEVLDEAVAKLSGGKSAFKLNCIEAEQYPDIELSETQDAFELDSKVLTELVEQTAFAAPAKATRPVLTAINLKAENGTLVATATDSARLSRKIVSVDPSINFVANVPAKTLLDIVHMLDGHPVVRLSCSPEKVLFAYGGTLISTSVVSGDYPISDKIIPTTFNYYLEANALELLSAIETATVLNAERTPIVKLTMSDAAVEVSTRNDLTGSGGTHLSTVQFTGQRLEITFNSVYVTDAIKAVRGQDVLISFIGEMKPFVIKNPKDDSIVELVTPMRSR